ncbi:hypothetical protein WG947_01405 [Pontibacter sp. H259]|uniref:hypothetical protein n=1 Tax=Pontibacter sp. H259 TaxID=3133421 RepID=UPI0030BCA6AB
MENVSDFIEFRIDPERKLLYGKWLRDVSVEEYKAGLQIIGQLLTEHAIKLWLQNSERLTPRSVPEQKWLTEEFAILLMQSVIKYIAVVADKNSPHSTGLATIREKAYRIFGKTKSVEIFESEEDALAWLIPNMQYYRLPATTHPVNTDKEL